MISFTVMDLDYSPTGTEFVSGSFDKTVRIFTCGQQRSRFSIVLLCCVCACAHVLLMLMLILGIPSYNSN
jgi:WD40 repeat protein